MAVKATNVTKVTFSQFKPKSFGSKEYETKPLSVGFVIGEVTRLTNKTDARSGEVFNGLGGSFRLVMSAETDLAKALESAKEGSILQSGICYLPEAFQGPIEDAFKAGEETNATVRFAIRVEIAKRGEDAYQWQCHDLMPVTSASPLDAIAAEVSQPAIEDKTAAPAGKGK